MFKKALKIAEVNYRRSHPSQTHVITEDLGHSTFHVVFLCIKILIIFFIDFLNNLFVKFLLNYL